MNPSTNTEYAYLDAPSWAITGNNANHWATQTSYCQNSVARATWVITAEETGTVTVACSTSYNRNEYHKLSVTVNGEVIAKDYAGSGVEHFVEVQASDTITIVAEFIILSTSSYIAKMKLTSTGQIAIEADIKTAPCRVFSKYTEGTGAIGGWEESELRQYYENTLKSMMPKNVRVGVKTVLKSQSAYKNNGTTSVPSFMQTTEDNLWVPSRIEMSSSSGSTNQPRYKALFPDNTSRIKSKTGDTKANKWFLRDVGYSSIVFYQISDKGGYGNANSYDTIGVPLCFCT